MGTSEEALGGGGAVGATDVKIVHGGERRELGLPEAWRRESSRWRERGSQTLRLGQMLTGTGGQVSAIGKTFQSPPHLRQLPAEAPASKLPPSGPEHTAPRE
jgi:hypothetical protein